MYDVEILDSRITLNVSDDAVTIQSKLQAALQTALTGRVVLVDIIDNGYFFENYRDYISNQPRKCGEVTIDSSGTGGAGPVETNATTVVEGSYAPLGGTFKLKVGNENSSDLRHNASLNEVSEKLMELSNVKLVNLSRMEGVIQFQGKEYYGCSWNVTFTELYDYQFLGQVDFGIYKGALDSENSIMLQELRSVPIYTDRNHDYLETNTFYEDRLIDGPTVDVEVTFNGQQYTSNSIRFHVIRPIQLLFLQPLYGPYSGGTLVTITIQPIESTVSELIGTDVRCKFDLLRSKPVS